MKVMISKFPGKCITCRGVIEPGQTIRFFGRGKASHFNCGKKEYCATDEDEAAGFEPGTLAADRRAARNGLSINRFSSGAVVTQNTRGRCEDAPCFGCCS